MDDTVEQALRARQRRVYVAGNATFNLGALRVCDDAIDKALLSASLYGDDVAAYLNAKINDLTGDARDAAVFLRLALAVQVRDPALIDITEGFIEQHLGAVRDAFWFYPVPSSPFSDNIDHVVRLFDREDAVTPLRILALELAGRRDVKQLHQRIYALRQDPELAPHVHLALARMDKMMAFVQEFIRTSLATGSDTLHQSALTIASIQPGLVEETALYAAVNTDPESYDLAWAMLACRHPRRIFERANQSKDVLPSLWLRIVSFTGYIDGIIQACADITACEGAITAQQADVLELALGAVPVETRTEPNNSIDKSKALRDLVLRACRLAHIKLHNDADKCAWDIHLILVEPVQAVGIRLRSGKVMREAIPPFTSSVFEVTHGLRQWLYIERASSANHALSLSAMDVGRRQELALMVAKLVDN
jgi:hypothetical protein